MQWSMPRAFTPVPSNPLTDYEGGHVSTFSRLDPIKAAAIAATQRFYATKWHTLLEGVGCTYESGHDAWAMTPRSLRERGGTHDHARHRLSTSWRYPTEWIERRLAAHHRRPDTDSASAITEQTWPWFSIGASSFSEVTFALPAEIRHADVLTYECSSLAYRTQSHRGRDRGQDLDASTGPAHFYRRAGHPYPDIWAFTDDDITERVWWHIVGQNHRRATQPAPVLNTLTIGQRHAVGTAVHTTDGSIYHLADDGKTTHLGEQITVVDCENDFHSRHPEVSS